MRILFLSVISVLLAACTNAPLDQRLAEAVQRFNDSEARNAPSSPGALTRTAGIEGGDTLVFKLANMPTGTTSFDPNAMRKSLRGEFCEDREMRELLEAGVKVRFDLTSNYGKELPSVKFARC